jgi:FixJ family two-component response regulator
VSKGNAPLPLNFDIDLRPLSKAMSQPTPPRLFVVDDEPLLVSTLADILNMSGFRAFPFTAALQALQAAEEEAPSILLSDVQMPGMNGIELAILFKGLYPACKILLFSGFSDISQLLESAKTQGHDFQILPKPMQPPELLSAIRGL